MANQEGIDIIIKATDQYTKTINNITASNELMGKSVKSVQKELDATTKLWTTLRVQGLDPASASMKVLEMNAQQLNFTLNSMKTAATGAGSAITGSSNNLKKSNQNWTALSLVVQDLPYGFRGIQNNLPALLGGIAGIGGAAYLAFSAVIATLTALDSGLISFGGKVKLATDYNKEFAQSLAEQKVKLDSLYGIATNVNKSMDDRITAAKKLKDEYPKLLENFSAEDIAAGKATTAYNKLSAAVVRYAKAQAAQTAIKEIVAKQIDNDLKIAEKELELKDANLSADKRQTEIDKKSFIYAAGTINLERVRASTINDNLVGLKAQNKELGIQLKKFEDIYDVNASFELDNTGLGKPTADKKPTVSRFDEQLAQEEFNFYKDSIFRAEEYFTKLNNIQKINALMEATIKGASADELFAIQQTYDQKALNFQQAQQSRIFEVLHQGQQLNKKLTDDYNKERIDAEVKFTEKYISSLDAQLKAQMRLNRNNVALQQENVKSQLQQLYFAQVFSAGNVKSLEAINAAIAKLKGNLTGLGDVSTTVGSILSSTLQDTFVGIGESLGELVTTGKFNFGTLGTILADALISIGKALILYSSLVQAAKKAIEAGQVKAGLIIGIAAVAAGFALKASMNKKRNTGTKEFANGGIISGPTYGLMGEYPGAASNPEVVAPLDKLKDMIGGGTGTLEARISGNDLLILMNKASRNNNNTF